VLRGVKCLDDYDTEIRPTLEDAIITVKYIGML